MSVAVWSSALSAPALAQDIMGAGSTFAFPIISKWVEAYQRLHGTRIAYQPIGSARGISDVISGAADFGVTDAPLVDAQLLRDGLLQFPLVIGAIVPVINVEGVDSKALRLTGPVLADIYLGRITHWHDPEIVRLNPGLSLPHKSILPVYRSDGSGTSYNWADFLSKSSMLWQAQVGVGTTLAWPVGVGGRGNRGVAENVARVKGAIGYVEYSYALDHNLAFALVRNRAGADVPPSLGSFQAALDGVDMSARTDFNALLTEAQRADAYPLAATSFVLMPRSQKDTARAARMMTFFQWVLDSGQEPARALGYLPLPQVLVAKVKAYWLSQISTPLE